MSFLTTNPNRHLITIPSLNGVVNSANGTSTEVAALTNTIANYINSNTNTASFNTVTSYTKNTPISFKNNVNLSNTSVLYNGTNLLTSNTLNTRLFTAFQLNSVEAARLTSNGLGIGTSNPIAPFHVVGDTVIQGGSLYISSFGIAPNSTIGNVYADGDLFATGIKYPSDPVLKANIVPYILQGSLPAPVEFIWKSNGQRDIGVLATDVANVESACVHTHPNGTRAVDYPKLVILCLAELKALREQVERQDQAIHELNQRIAGSAAAMAVINPANPISEYVAPLDT
jgi:hypothetical protein